METAPPPRALHKRLKQSHFSNPAQEAVLSLLVAAGYFHEQMDRLCAEHGLTSGQYNVLRILQGAHPDGYARCDIIDRMVERAPDVTRLIDRLVRQGLVKRVRSDVDRRLSIAQITEQGQAVLNKMRPAVDAMQQHITERLNAEECQALTRLCEKIYG